MENKTDKGKRQTLGACTPKANFFTISLSVLGAMEGLGGLLIGASPAGLPYFYFAMVT
jgi:hypothetical protein